LAANPREKARIFDLALHSKPLERPLAEFIPNPEKLTELAGLTAFFAFIRVHSRKFAAHLFLICSHQCKSAAEFL
jgi:hypothetical protein